MTQEQITEGNKLIAKFMGIETKVYSDRPSVTYYNYNNSMNTVDQMKYHSSWYWLMPVIDRIAKDCTINIHSYPDNGFDMVIKEGNYRRGFGEHPKSRILSAWIAIVDFINWYNKEE